MLPLIFILHNDDPSLSVVHSRLQAPLPKSFADGLPVVEQKDASSHKKRCASQHKLSMHLDIMLNQLTL